MNESDATNTTTTVIPEEISPSISKFIRRSSIFRSTIIEPKDEDGENTTEYRNSIQQEKEKWREFYLDIKAKYIDISKIYSDPTQTLPFHSEDYDNFLKQVVNFIEKSENFFEQIHFISKMNFTTVSFKEIIEQKLELQNSLLKEQIKNLLNKIET